MDASQDILVVSGNGERIIDVTVAAFLVLKKKRRVIESSHFGKSPVIVSVEAP